MLLFVSRWSRPLVQTNKTSFVNIFFPLVVALLVFLLRSFLPCLPRSGPPRRSKSALVTPGTTKANDKNGEQNLEVKEGGGEKASRRKRQTQAAALQYSTSQSRPHTRNISGNYLINFKRDVP